MYSHVVDYHYHYHYHYHYDYYYYYYYYYRGALHNKDTVGSVHKNHGNAFRPVCLHLLPFLAAWSFSTGWVVGTWYLLIDAYRESGARYLANNSNICHLSLFKNRECGTAGATTPTAQQ